MIRHIVLFRFNSGVDWSHEEALRAERLTHAHPLAIPEIVGWTAGRNMTPRAGAYDFALVGLFRDRQGLDRYMDHADHQRGVSAWREISTWVVVDLEVPSTEDEAVSPDIA